MGHQRTPDPHHQASQVTFDQPDYPRRDAHCSNSGSRHRLPWFWLSKRRNIEEEAHVADPQRVHALHRGGSGYHHSITPEQRGRGSRGIVLLARTMKKKNRESCFTQRENGSHLICCAFFEDTPLVNAWVPKEALATLQAGQGPEHNCVPRDPACENESQKALAAHVSRCAFSTTASSSARPSQDT